MVAHCRHQFENFIIGIVRKLRQTRQWYITGYWFLLKPLLMYITDQNSS